MSSVPEVGSGQVAIFPVFKGFRKATDQEATRSTASAAGIFRGGFTKAGADAGIGFSKSFSSSSAAGFKDLTAAAAKAAREVSASRLKEQDAAGRLRIAEAQLLETRAKYSNESSQVIRAEERLATAQRALQTVQSGVAASTDRLAAAKRDLAAASVSANSAGERSTSVFSRMGSVFSGGGREGAARFSQGFKDVLGGVLGANILTGIGYTIGRTIGDGARAGIGYTLDSIGLASELQQNTGAAAAVFKDQVDQITEGSRTAATSVGLTRSAYQKYATVVGAQLKNLGVRSGDVAGKTIDLIELGADLAAQFGGPTSEAVGALSSLLRGERDPIERYGVSLKQVDIDAEKARLGLVGLTGEADKQADITATLGLLWGQTADAQGRFAAESDTYAGKQQRLIAQLEEQQTRLGEALLPTATEVLQFANDDLLPILDSAIRESGPVLVESIRGIMPEVKDLVATVADNLPDAIRAATGFLSLASESFQADFARGSKGPFDPAAWEILQSDAEGFFTFLTTGIGSTDDYWRTTSDGFNVWWQRFNDINYRTTQETSDEIKAYWVTSIDETILELNQRGKDFVATGETWGAGLAEGFRNSKATVREAAADLAQEAVRTTIQGWDARSPSRKARRVAGYWGDGIALGISDGKPKVSAASMDLARAAVFEATQPAPFSLQQILAPAALVAPAPIATDQKVRDITLVNPDPYVLLAMLKQELAGGMATK